MRTWLYQRLSTDGGLMALLPGGLHENRSLNDVPELKPFGVYTMGLTTPRIKDGGTTIASSQMAQVWIHDDPGDYLLIDSALRYLEVLLESTPPGPVQAEWIEESEDLYDDEMNTATKFARVRLVTRL